MFPVNGYERKQNPDHIIVNQFRFFLVWQRVQVDECCLEHRRVSYSLQAARRQLAILMDSLLRIRCSPSCILGAYF